MYLPEIHDERETLCSSLAAQLDGVRGTVHGLSDEQARLRPLRSALSLSGILKHVTYAMLQSLVGAGLRKAEEADQDFYASFEPTEAETLEALLQRFDEVREEYLEMCRGGELDAVLPVGPMPWYGLDEPQPAHLRYLYVHHIEEFARHAGHADIIREQIDGADAASLMATIEGRPANQFVTPWEPSN
ncbi:DinB family protein [Luteococcus peritonei]|uniref:DinB family protein n=1 Tax=Luteococcus peritonei TaxID=88874 RepID=A0ABW4RUN4_9ACTN